MANHEKDFVKKFGTFGYDKITRDRCYLLPNQINEDEVLYREYQRKIVDEGLVSYNLLRFESISRTLLTILISICFSVVMGSLCLFIWDSFLLFLPGILFSQKLANMFNNRLEKFLWITLPMRKYLEGCKEKENVINSLKEEALTGHKNSVLEKSDAKDSSEYLKTLNSFLDIMDTKFSNLTYSEVFTVIRKIKECLSNNLNLNYHKIINIYLREIMKLIIQNENNDKKYTHKILELVSKLNKFIDKEKAKEQRMDVMDMSSSMIALNNLFEQDGIGEN